MSDDRPTLGQISRAIIAGDPVPPREQVIYAIGVHFAGHPIYLWPWRQGGENQSPTEHSGSSLGYEADRKSVRIQRPEWREGRSDQERKFHDVNGCLNCPKVDAKKRTTACSNPRYFGAVVLLEVKWREVANFVRPALTVQNQDRLAEFLERRKEATVTGSDVFSAIYPKQSATEEEREAYRVRAAERTAAWNAIEQEGRALATEVWDEAYGLHMVRAVMARG